MSFATLGQFSSRSRLLRRTGLSLAASAALLCPACEDPGREPEQTTSGSTTSSSTTSGESTDSESTETSVCETGGQGIDDFAVHPSGTVNLGSSILHFRSAGYAVAVCTAQRVFVVRYSEDEVDQSPTSSSLSIEGGCDALDFDGELLVVASGSSATIIDARAGELSVLASGFAMHDVADPTQTIAPDAGVQNVLLLKNRVEGVETGARTVYLGARGHGVYRAEIDPTGGISRLPSWAFEQDDVIDIVDLSPHGVGVVDVNKGLLLVDPADATVRLTYLRADASQQTKVQRAWVQGGDFFLSYGLLGVERLRILDVSGGPVIYSDQLMPVSDTHAVAAAWIGPDRLMTVELTKISIFTVTGVGELVLDSVEEAPALAARDGEWFRAAGVLGDQTVVGALGTKLKRWRALENRIESRLSLLASVGYSSNAGGAQQRGFITGVNRGAQDLYVSRVEVADNAPFIVTSVGGAPDGICSQARWIKSINGQFALSVVYTGDAEVVEHADIWVYSDDPSQHTIQLEARSSPWTLEESTGRSFDDFGSWKLPTFDGAMLDTASLKGRYTVLDFAKFAQADEMAAKIEGLQASIVDVWGGDRVQGFVVCSDRDGRNELDLIDSALGQFPRRNVSLAYDPYSDMVGAFSRRESDSGARVYPFRLVVDPQGVIAYSDQNAGLEGVVAFLNSQLGR